MKDFLNVLGKVFLDTDFLNFKKISIHEHYRSGGNIESFIWAMRILNIEKAVFLPTDWPPYNPIFKNHLYRLFDFKKKFGERIIIFTTCYSGDTTAAEFIEETIKNGAQGIKFIDWFYSEKTKNFIADINSENMYKVYEVANKYQVPVLLHIDFHKNNKFLNQFEEIAKKFSTVNFILAHYASCILDEKVSLSLCEYLLSKYSNVFIDISSGYGIKKYMTIVEFNKDMFRNFLIKFQDKILWAADIVIDDDPQKNFLWFVKRIILDLSILQKEYYQDILFASKEYYEGLALPVDVLKKIYYNNAKAILKL